MVTAIGPFVQQIIAFRPMPFAAGNAYLPIVQLNPVFDGDLAPAHLPEVYKSLVSAAMAPPGSKFDVSQTCINANCTWEPYYTLSVTPNCVDLSSQLEVHSNCLNIGGNLYNCSTAPSTCVPAPGISGSFLGCPEGYAAAQMINFTTTLPDGETFLMEDYSSYCYLNSSTPDCRSMIDVPYRFRYNKTELPGDSDVMGNNGGIIQGVTAFAGYANPINYTFQLFTWEPRAVQCFLQVTGQKMQASVVNGKFEERAIGPPLANNTFWGLYNFRYGSCMYPDNQTMAMVIENPDDVYLAAGRCNPMFRNLAVVLERLLLDSDTPLWKLLGANLNPDLETDFKQMMDRWASSIGDAFGNMARQMTTLIRQSGSSVAAPLKDRPVPHPINWTAVSEKYKPAWNATGLATNEVVTIKINWAWITLPVTLLGLVGLLIVFTALDVHLKKLPTWGPGTLPMIFHGADDETRRSLLECKDLDSVKDFAKRTRVQLSREEGVLVAVSSSSSEPSEIPPAQECKAPIEPLKPAYAVSVHSRSLSGAVSPEEEQAEETRSFISEDPRWDTGDARQQS